MSRSLTAAVLSEIANAVTTPAYLVEIQFSAPLRMSTRGSIVWDGNAWGARGVNISGLSYDIASSQQSGALTVFDSDLAMSALVLREGISGRTVRVWKFYGDAPAPADPLQIFDGVGDAATFNPEEGTVTIALVQRGATELYAPRRYMTRANGFSILPVTGRVVSFNGVNFKLERYRG